MARQQALFPGADAPPAPPSQSLVLRAKAGRPLNKLQQAFNRLVAKIERLRVSMERERERLEAALVFHAEHVRPRLLEVVALRKDLVRTLRPFLYDHRIKRNDSRTLRELLAEQLDDVLAHDASPDVDLGELFEELHGTSVADLERDQMQEARAAMEAMCEEMGLDIDLSDLHPGMSDEEIAAKSAEMAAEMKRRAEAEAAAAERPRRPSSKRAQREAERARQAEATRKISIGAIYRQLAKALHPDLEQDPDRRRQKVVLMQEVTTAYARNDLHTLLRLELEWIRREEADVARLTDEKLTAINQVLKEQVAQLEWELEQLPYHPRFRSLVHDDPFADPFAGGWRRGIGSDLPDQARRMDLQSISLTLMLERLRSPKALQALREALREHRAARRHFVRFV